VVTGASSGIGRAVAMCLAHRGVHVALNGRNEERLEETRRSCEQAGVNAHAVPGDAGDEAVLRSLFGFQPDLPLGAVFAAGYARFGDTLSLDEAVWNATLHANLTALFRGNRIAIETMLARGGGRVVNVLSIASRVAFPFSAAYVASKYGALGLTRSLAAEFRSRGVELIAFMPGSTDTELWDAQESALDRTKMMKPEDVAVGIVNALLHEGEAYLDEVLLMPPGGVL
jgi:3-oxoacyl-[acyl-carrier protein] reductase